MIWVHTLLFSKYQSLAIGYYTATWAICGNTVTAKNFTSSHRRCSWEMHSYSDFMHYGWQGRTTHCETTTTSFTPTDSLYRYVGIVWRREYANTTGSSRKPSYKLHNNISIRVIQKNLTHSTICSRIAQLFPVLSTKLGTYIILCCTIDALL